MTRICKITAALALLMFPVQAAQSGEHEITWYGRIKGQRPGTRARIWVMEADGSNPEYVYETCGPGQPSWSPDGSRIAVYQWSSPGLVDSLGLGFSALCWAR